MAVVGMGSIDTVKFDPAVARSAHSADRLAAEVAAMSAELAAARSAARDAASEHAAETQRLHHELIQTKRALVLLQQSVSWRLTRPLRTARRLLRP